MKRGPKPKTIGQIVDKIFANSVRQSNGCLEFKAGSNVGNGYKYVCFEARDWYAHRLVFFYLSGYLPEVVRHKCDNKVCVEFEHLIAGTHSDNVADKVKRNRQLKGSQIHNSVLHEGIITEIFNAHGTYSELSKKYGISRGGIHNIKSGRTWSHITGKTHVAETRTKHTLLNLNLEDFR